MAGTGHLTVHRLIPRPVLLLPLKTTPCSYCGDDVNWGMYAANTHARTHLRHGEITEDEKIRLVAMLTGHRDNDKLTREALGHIPTGYYRVKDGEIASDDLIWSWTSREWLRADDPQWRSHVAAVEDCVCVIRAAAKNKPTSPYARKYSIRA